MTTLGVTLPDLLWDHLALDVEDLFGDADVPEDFTVLYRAAYPKVLKFFEYSFRDPEDARDRAQDTFLAVFERWEDVEAGRIESVTRFLWKIARHKRDDQYRAQNPTYRRSGATVRVGISELTDLVADAVHRDGLDSPLEVQACLDEEASMVRMAMVDLARRSPAQHEAVFLRYLAEMMPAEIAKVTGKSQKTITSNIRQGLVRLRPMVLERMARRLAGAETEQPGALPRPRSVRQP